MIKTCNIKKLILAVLFSIVATSASSQQTSQQCAPRVKVIERLADKYGEHRQSIGLTSNNSVIEIFVNTQTGTWTITMTTHDGVSCLVADGEHYEQLQMPNVDPDA